MPCVLNAANEIAVASFLAGNLPFTGIDEVVDACMDAHTVEVVQSLQQLLDIDAQTRVRARELVRARLR